MITLCEEEDECFSFNDNLSVMEQGKELTHIFRPSSLLDKRKFNTDSPNIRCHGCCQIGNMEENNTSCYGKVTKMHKNIAKEKKRRKKEITKGQKKKNRNIVMKKVAKIVKNMKRREIIS